MIASFGVGCCQAILHALWSAEAVSGRDGNRRRTLLDLLPELESRS